MKNISTGFGLALLAGAILAYPFVSSLAPSANASAVTAAVSAVSTAATRQTAPTIVWYGTEYNSTSNIMYVIRSWSDGRVEMKMGRPNCDSNGVLWQNPDCGSGCPDCQDRWGVINDPAQGLTFNADLNFDQAVDGADLGELLAKWGPAPRNPVPPSDCPLALINP
jgi:hypothetical protein